MSMCGHFQLKRKDLKKISKQFSILEDIPNEDIKPYQPALVLFNDKTSKILQFGLQKKSLIVNAKSETLFDKYTFQKIIQNKCIIPASFYYEKNTHKNNVKIFKEELMYFAGLYENNQFVIITTKANDSIQPIHHRMPLILNEEEMMDWLENKNIETILQKECEPLQNNQKLEQLSLF